VTYVPQCFSCKWFRWGTDYTCEAFPDGIPHEILSNSHHHVTPYPGDRGILFEPEPVTQTGGGRGTPARGSR
jgi:hypothetical protein